jgi:hypothetical protein
VMQDWGNGVYLGDSGRRIGVWQHCQQHLMHPGSAPVRSDPDISQGPDDVCGDSDAGGTDRLFS